MINLSSDLALQMRPATASIIKTNTNTGNKKVLNRLKKLKIDKKCQSVNVISKTYVIDSRTTRATKTS